MNRWNAILGMKAMLGSRLRMIFSDVANNGRRTLAFAILIALASHSVCSASSLSFTAKLVVLGSAGRQGSALTAVGNQVVVGAHGSAFLWERTETGTWTLRQELRESQSTVWFGESVALSDGWLAIGDEQGGDLVSGAVYIYREAPNGLYEFQQMLESPTPRNQGQFGRSIAFVGTALIVGAPKESSQGKGFGVPIDGGAHVYSLDEAQNWIHRSASRAPNFRSGGGFGLPVTTNGTGQVLVAEADAQVPLGNQSRGAIHVCSIGVDSALTCVERVRSGGVAFEHFGRSLVSAADGTLVSAPGGVGMLGTVSIFEHLPTPWTLSATITAPEHARGWSFGTSILRVGQSIFAAAPWRNDTELDFSGTVYHFQAVLGVWTERHRFSIPGGAGGDTTSDFGSALSASGEFLFVGASGLESLSHSAQGAVFVYVVPMFADSFD